MSLKIVSNHQWRDFVYRYDVPASVMADQFDYHDDDETDGYFRYRGIWYHLDQFMNGFDADHPQWHGYHGDSFFSGIVVEISEDGEQYRVGTYFYRSDTAPTEIELAHESRARYTK